MSSRRPQLGRKGGRPPKGAPGGREEEEGVRNESSRQHYPNRRATTPSTLLEADERRVSDHIRIVQIRSLARRPDTANCRVSIHPQGELAVLELTDNGGGIHAEEEHPRELQELVVGIGIEVAIEITPELGATLRATLPG